jgi:hypothetical protein
MRARRSVGLAASVIAVVFAATSATSPRADDAPSVAQRCIRVDQIDQTRIVDERSILFFMRNKTVLQNVLPHRCSGLRTSDRIKYDVVADRLCANEVITQLVDVGTYSPGVRCSIGMFVPIGDDEAQRLLPRRRSKRGETTGQPVIESKPAEPPRPAAHDAAGNAPVPPVRESGGPSADAQTAAPR